MWYHYIGIGGVGMSALAAIMLSKGHKVTGSDIKESKEVKQLRELGAKVYIGHKGENIQEPDVVVYSSAIKEDNPERVLARKRGIKELHRSENLAEILNHNYGIAIAGSHGKTTTSAMVAYMLSKLQKDPTALIGGYVPQFRGNYLVGENDLVVAEADESDGSFLNYKPMIGSVSSVEADHLENYGFNLDKLYEAYSQFVNNIQSLALICADDKKTASLKDFARGKVLTYGISDGDLQAYDIKEGLSTKFRVRFKKEDLGEFEISLPGKHNVANTLVAIGIALELGLDLDEVKVALKDFVGTGRRFETRFEKNGLLVIDDYAHHPTEIKATVAAARKRYPDKELWLAFQPHRYSRTKIFWQEFIESLKKADKIVILGIYAPPPEEPIEGISGNNLALELQKLGKTTYYLETLDEAAEFLANNLLANSLLLTMGAGDITKLPDLLQQKLD